METVSDEPGATIPWLGRTRYLRGWVVFTWMYNESWIKGGELNCDGWTAVN